jgi:hypothetical protein
MKRTIRLTESDLRKVVKESVSKILNEYAESPDGQFQIGRLAHRKGEECPTLGVNYSKMKKNKKDNPIFHYSEKRGKENNLDSSLRYFQRGHKYQNLLGKYENLENIEDKYKLIYTEVVYLTLQCRNHRAFQKVLDEVLGNRYIENLSMEELDNFVYNVLPKLYKI